MSEAIVHIIDDDIAFINMIQTKLTQFGLKCVVHTKNTDIRTFNRRDQRVFAFVINLHSRYNDGIGIFQSLRNNAVFRNSLFILLLEDRPENNLIQDLPLERVTFLKKDTPIEILIFRIIDKIPPNFWLESHETSFNELAGEIGDIRMSEILTYCHKSYFTGILELENSNNDYKIHFHIGLIRKVEGTPLHVSHFLDALMKWNSGSFVILRDRITTDTLKAIYRRINGEHNSPKDFTIYIEDLFTDVFYYLKIILSDYLSLEQVEYCFIEAQSELSTEFPFLGKIELQRRKDEIYLFNFKLTRENISGLRHLFRIILSHAVSFNSQIEYQDIRGYFSELMPFLKKYNFFNRQIRYPHDFWEDKGKSDQL